MVGSIAPILIIFLLILFLPNLLQYLVGDYYLAQILTSIIVSFIYACLRNGGFKSIITADFWKSFFTWGILLLLVDLLMFQLMTI